MGLKDWVILALSLVVALLASELVSWAPTASDVLRRLAVSLLPPHHRARADEEWERELEDIPGPLSKVLAALTWIIKAGTYRNSTTQEVAIRIFDITVASALLLLELPIMLLIAIAVNISDGGPILIAEECIGRYGKKIRALKFRTSRVCIENCDPSVTLVGKFLRQKSLDELPQLFNVIFGEMTLVGPGGMVAGGKKKTIPKDSRRD